MGLIIALEVGAGGQTRCSDPVDHRPIPQDGQIETVSVERDERRTEGVHAGGKSRDQIGLGPLLDMWGAE